MATKDQRKETRDEREFPATSRQWPAGGFGIENVEFRIEKFRGGKRLNE
jgi:hypothetical protein